MPGLAEVTQALVRAGALQAPAGTPDALAAPQRSATVPYVPPEDPPRVEPTEFRPSCAPPSLFGPGKGPYLRSKPLPRCRIGVEQGPTTVRSEWMESYVNERTRARIERRKSERPQVAASLENLLIRFGDPDESDNYGVGSRLHQWDIFEPRWRDGVVAGWEPWQPSSRKRTTVPHVPLLSLEVRPDRWRRAGSLWFSMDANLERWAFNDFRDPHPADDVDDAKIVEVALEYGAMLELHELACLAELDSPSAGRAVWRMRKAGKLRRVPGTSLLVATELDLRAVPRG